MTKLNWIWENFEGLFVLTIALILTGFLLFSSIGLVISLVISDIDQLGKTMASIIGLILFSYITFKLGLHMVSKDNKDISHLRDVAKKLFR